MAVHNRASPSVADPQDEATAEASAVETAAEPATRQCSRCRKPFDRQPGDLPAAQGSWWLCPPCHEVLIAGVGRGRQP